jgi:hypothetical protein
MCKKIAYGTYEKYKNILETETTFLF